MKFHWLVMAIVSLALSACNTASPAFMGIEAERITIGSSTFDVRRKGYRVELIRINPEAVFSLPAIVPRAALAVIQVTGCDPQPGTWTGDHAMMQVQISCVD